MALETETEGIVNADGPLTPAEARHLKMLEGRIERGLHTFQTVGEALQQVRDQRLYRVSHPTFEAYCRDRWDLARDRAYQLIGAAEVVKVLPEGPVNEAQARELVPLVHAQPERVKAVWAEVQERVKVTGKPVTAGLIREAVQTIVPTAPSEPPPSPAEALAQRFVGLATAYARWKATKPGRRDQAIVKAAVARLFEVTGNPPA